MAAIRQTNRHLKCSTVKVCSTVEDIQYGAGILAISAGEISFVRWEIFSVVEGIQHNGEISSILKRDIINTMKGYH